MVKLAWFIIGGQLSFGTLYSIIQKVLLQQESAGFNNIEHKFDKPFAQTFLMTLAMLICLIIHKFWDSNGKGPHPPTPWRTRIYLSIPASCDLIATTLNVFGLIYINVSIFQMLRGAHIIFTTIFSVIFLKKKITGYEIIGILFVVIALVLVGWAGMYIPSIEGGSESEEHSFGQKLFGTFIIVCAQIFAASQCVIEDYLLNIKFQGKLGGLEVIGNEGLMGWLILVLIFLPFAFICPGQDPSPMPKGSLENIWDTCLMVYNNPRILISLFLFILFSWGFNISVILLIAYTSSLNFAIVDTVRTLLIWICMLISAAVGLSFGEPWTKYSFMELAGFVLLVAGNFIFNGIIKLPWFTYTENGASQFHEVNPNSQNYSLLEKEDNLNHE